MFFHRGKKIRPEIREFTLGIQKSTSAIENAVGCMLTIFECATCDNFRIF